MCVYIYIYIYIYSTCTVDISSHYTPLPYVALPACRYAYSTWQDRLSYDMI